MKKVQIYTDGACSGNQYDKNIGGYGAILKFGEHKKEIYGGKINTTNNKMELLAIIEALKTIKNKDISIDIFSDSSYVVDCFRKNWYVNWENNGWKTSAKKAVENQNLWQELLSLVRGISNVNFYRVKGHLKISKTAEITKWYNKYKQNMNPDCSRDEFHFLVEMNNRADELANIGMDKIRGC